MSNQVCPHARRQAIANASENPPPTLPDDATPGEIKPFYYGLLAPVIEDIIALGLQGSPLMNRLAYTSRDPFSRLYIDVAYHLNDATGEILERAGDSEHMHRLVQAHRQMIRTRQATFDTVDKVLQAGSSTAAESTVWHIQTFSRFLGASAIANRMEVLRASHKVLIRNASISVGQLGLLGVSRSAKELPAVFYNERNAEVRYAQDLTDCPLTEAHHQKYGYTRVSDATTIGEVKPWTVTIGCPILLRSGQTQALWNRVIDWAQEREVIAPTF